MQVTLPDGKVLELPDGATGADLAASIGAGLARAADFSSARAMYRAAAAREPLQRADRARAALAAVPIARRLAGRRDPYR